MESNVGHKIFISFSSKDKKLAEKIYSHLNKNDLPCWISSKDIPAGADYQACIVDAIDKASLVVLVFSANANNSSEIAKELSLASKKVLIPIRIEDVLPAGAFQYQLSNRQFIDLYEDFESGLNDLTDRVRLALSSGSSGSDGQITDTGTRKIKKSKVVPISSAVIAVIAATALAGYYASQPKTPDSKVTAMTPPPGDKPPAPQVAKGLETKAGVDDSKSNNVQSVAEKPGDVPQRTEAVPPLKASAQESASERVKDVLSALKDLTVYNRESALKTMRDSIPANLSSYEAEALLKGTGQARVNAISSIVVKIAPNQNGEDVARILGDLTRYDRDNALRALLRAEKVKPKLSSSEAVLILDGTHQVRARAIEALSFSLSPDLTGQDVAAVLGDTSVYDRENAIRSLVRAEKIKKGLLPAEANLILNGANQARANAIASIASALATNLGGNDVGVVLGELSTYDRENALKSLVRAGVIKNGLTMGELKPILTGMNAAQNNALLALSPYMAKN